MLRRELENIENVRKARNVGRVVGAPAVFLPPDGSYLQLPVRDPRMGIAPEIMVHIFEPYVTTEETGRGSGHGFSVAREIVQHLGGEMSVIR